MNWNIYKLATGPLKDRDTCINWLVEKALIPSSKYCARHKKQMTVVNDDFLGKFRCRGKSSDHQESRANNTWFQESRLSPEQVVLLTYAFTTSMTYDDAIRECSIGSKLSRETVSDRWSYCREICMIALDDKFEASGRIGGPGHVVEVDECKIGRRKYNRGRLVDGHWLVGMIDLNGDFRIEICPDNKRDRMTLAQIITKHVEPGTVIYTDCWKGYNNLEDSGYEHLTVNHSMNFRDPDTWCDTQKIEAQWRPIRRRVSRGGVKELDMHLCEFLWKRECKQNNLDMFEQMINEIVKVYPGQ
jgi:transposase-like protein